MASIPWSEQHVATLEASTLPKARGGYLPEDVERQLLRVTSLMRQQRPVPALRTTALRRAGMRQGYAAPAVEALFGHIAKWQQELHADLAAPPRAQPTPQAAPVRTWTRQQQDWVRNAVFARRSGNRAYCETEVDDFLDAVLVAMANGDELPATESVLFYPPKRGRAGYDAIGVDQFLDQLATLRPLID